MVLSFCFLCVVFNMPGLPELLRCPHAPFLCSHSLRKDRKPSSFFFLANNFQSLEVIYIILKGVNKTMQVFERWNFRKRLVLERQTESREQKFKGRWTDFEHTICAYSILRRSMDHRLAELKDETKQMLSMAHTS
ncbi:unnamed protein product [Cuscuta epithymum]|uniref:Uncharacterized protein n=1 Tax=Cuscuta epithymum TaxID=186058 RepID=A0AAV0ER81_9ASTE|nr:unnamed protein product [Cuscuta epithymum]